MKIKNGFTLIEAIIFIVVMSIGLGTLASIYISAIQKSTMGEYLSIAMALCEKKMEEMIVKPFTEIKSVDLNYFEEPFRDYSYEIKVYNADPEDPNKPSRNDAGYKKIHIRVYHRGINPVETTFIKTDFEIE